MKVSFSQIYPEIDTSFDMTNTILKELSGEINDLNIVFEHYKKLFNTDDFFIVFIISATRKNPELVVKGPTTLPKKKKAEFVFHIPYRETTSFHEKIEYVLPFIENGIRFVFEKYKADSYKIKDAVNAVGALINADPEKYSKWTK